MTSRVRKSFIDNLKSADWMNYDTRQSAKEKVKRKENISPQFHTLSHCFPITCNIFVVNP